MELPFSFADFLGEIRLTPSQVHDLKTGHRALRDRLAADSGLADLIVSTFLQGSYRRATAVRPKGDRRADVDIIVVTNLDRNVYEPEEALCLFIPFMEKYYKEKYRLQGRSIGITMSYVDLDVVVTSAPSESQKALLKSASVITERTLEELEDWRLVKSWVPPEERDTRGAPALMAMARTEAEWKLEPLWIPDRDAKRWERTHPLEQIRWTREKNAQCHSHYVNVVKAIKWWRMIHLEALKHPKGYPLEHLVGVCCPDKIESVAQGVTFSLEQIAHQYAANAARQETPFLPDHGVPEHNVLHRVSGEDFATFYNQATEAADIARQALNSEDVAESAQLWRRLFGEKFPKPSGREENEGNSETEGYTPRSRVSIIGGTRYA